MAATKWTPQVIAAEVARKQALGKDRNYGKDTPAAAPKLQVKTPAPAPVPFNKGAYAAGQTARYNNAVSSGDAGLVTRLQNDSKRVGYALPQLNVKTDPYNGSNSVKTDIKTDAGTGGNTGYFNAATNTGNEAPKLGYGGVTYGTSGAANKAVMANGDRLKNDPNFKASEITRSQGVISALEQELAKDPNNADLKTRLDGAKKYLNVNLGYTPEPKVDDVTTDQAPVQEEPFDPAAFEKNAIEQEIAAYLARSEAALSATNFGINNNNAFLEEQIGKMRTAKNQNDLSIQETENRFGSVYSGGMRLNQAANLTSTNEAIGGATRDIATRNQQLIDQYGIQAGSIADQIQRLQTNTPDIIRQKINDWMTKKAEMTGDYNGGRTLAGQEIDWNKDPSNPAVAAQNIANKISQIKLDNMPEEMRLGLESLRQEVASGKVNAQEAEIKLKELQDPNSIPNQMKRLDLEAAKLGNQELRKRIAEIGKMPVVSREDQLLKEIELKKAEIELENLQNGGSGQTADKVRVYFDSMVERDSEGKITNKQELEQAILEDPSISDFVAYQLTLKYGIPWHGPVPQPGTQPGK